MRDYELVVVSYRSRHEIETTLAGLPRDIPVALIDNANGVDRLDDLAESRPGTRYLEGGGQGFAHAANLGAFSSAHDIVIFVNPDARPSVDVLDELADDVRHDPRCASSAAITVGADGSTEMTGGWEPTVARALVHAAGIHKVAPHAGIFIRPVKGIPVDVDWTSGPCMAVNRRVFTELGGWDERFFVYNEDVAFGRTVRDNGYYQRLRTDLEVLHASGGSGAPSLEMMRLRGASMNRYVGARNRPAASRTMTAALASGYLARALQRRLLGDHQRSHEHMAYVRGVLTGKAYVGDREVAAMAAARGEAGSPTSCA
jgi:N-acetylglucosaminyl-diphospho-decaprenol L-rhamnosyltransferase